MEGNKLQELRELIEFLKANEIAEFDMEREDLSLSLGARELRPRIRLANLCSTASGRRIDQICTV